MSIAKSLALFRARTVQYSSAELDSQKSWGKWLLVLLAAQPILVGLALTIDGLVFVVGAITSIGIAGFAAKRFSGISGFKFLGAVAGLIALRALLDMCGILPYETLITAGGTSLALAAGVGAWFHTISRTWRRIDEDLASEGREVWKIVVSFSAVLIGCAFFQVPTPQAAPGMVFLGNVVTLGCSARLIWRYVGILSTRVPSGKVRWEEKEEEEKMDSH